VTTSKLPAYLSWEFDVQDEAARRPSIDLLATGVGGILYPPNSLHPDVREAALFQRLCPTGDDLWFYWMARRIGTMYLKVGPAFDTIIWPGTDEHALFHQNADANDWQIGALLERYGLPTGLV
jgi:hypothetical protein